MEPVQREDRFRNLPEIWGWKNPLGEILFWFHVTWSYQKLKTPQGWKWTWHDWKVFLFGKTRQFFSVWSPQVRTCHWIGFLLQGHFQAFASLPSFSRHGEVSRVSVLGGEISLFARCLLSHACCRCPDQKHVPPKCQVKHCREWRADIEALRIVWQKGSLNLVCTRRI